MDGVGNRQQIAGRVRRRVDAPIADVAPPMFSAVRIRIRFVRFSVPTRVDPVDVERKIILETVVKNLDHHLRGLISAPGGEGDDRTADVSFGVARRIMFHHEGVNGRLEASTIRVLALRDENRRLQERFVRSQAEIRIEHPQFDAILSVLVRERRAPRSCPPDAIKRAVERIDARFDIRRNLVGGSPARSRQDVCFSGLDELFNRLEILGDAI